MDKKIWWLVKGKSLLGNQASFSSEKAI